MNYEQAMEFLYGTSWMGSKLGLDRMQEQMRRLSDPQKKIPCIHIAGTNGKGSVAAMLASIYREAGYRTGLYTSPAIAYFGERIQLDGVPIPREAVASLSEKMKQATESMDDPPTEYERITALAYLYFAEEEVDIAIIETGLGGLLDATNVIDRPAASVITAIGLDHTQELGFSLEAITEQKAGIIKKHAPVILYEQKGTVEDVIRSRAKELHAPLRIASCASFSQVEFGTDGTRFTHANNVYHLPLLGTHQIRNAAVVLETVDALSERFPVTVEQLQKGLSAAVWTGRFEILHKDPVVVLDGAHNPPAVQALKKNLVTYFPDKKITFLVGVLADKGYNKMVEELRPMASAWITVTPDSDRALPGHELAELISAEVPVRTAERIDDALRDFLENAESSEVLCVFGTLTLIHAVRTFFGQ